MTRVPDSGSLDEHSVPALLLDLHRARFDGAVTLTRDRVEKRVLIQQGAPVAVESNLASESLGIQLMDAGLLDRSDHARVTQAVEESGCQEGAALLALKLAHPKTLFQALKTQLRMRLHTCFEWSHGRFALEPDALAPEHVQPFRTDPFRLVLDGLVRHWSVERIVQGLAEHLNHYPVPTREFASLSRRLPEHVGVTALRDALDGTRDLTQALGPGASIPDVLAAAWTLARAGGLEFRDGPVSRDDEVAPEIEIEVSDAAAASAKPSDSRKATRAAGRTREAGGADADKMRQEIGEQHERLDELTHYEVLGVEPDAKSGAIKKAYIQAAKRYHPDALARLDLSDLKAQAGEVFARIGEAHAVLGNVDRRSNYDAELAGGAGELDTALLAQAETFYRKGEILVRMGDFRGALEFLGPAVELWPEEATYQSALGWALYKAMPPNPEQAKEHLEKAVELEDGDAVSHFRLGVVLRALGDTNRAAEHMAQAKQLDPKIS